MARKLEVQITGDASSLSRAFGKSARDADSFGSSLGRLGKTAALAAGAAGIGALIVGLKLGTDEFMESAKVSAQTDAALKSTGEAAGVTADQIGELATALMEKSGVDDEAIQSGENLLLTFTNIRNEAGKGNDVFNQATQAALDLSVAFGKDMTQSSILVGKALNDPIKGLTALSRVGVSFTKGQKETIKSLVESGDTMKAQKIILAELTKETGGSAEAFGKTLPGQLNIAKESFSNFAGGLVAKMVPAITTVFDWFGKLGKEMGKEKTFIGKVKILWTNIKEAAQSLATKLNEFFWSGWTEQIGTSGGPQMGVTKIHEGLLKQIGSLDWGAIGKGILAGIVAGLTVSAELVGKLSDIVSETMGSIDWESLGRKMGPALITGLLAAFNAVLDPGFWVRNWDLVLAVALTAFTSGIGGFAEKIGVKAAVALEKLAPTMAAGLLKALIIVGQTFEKLGPLIAKAFSPIEALVRRLFGRLGTLAVFVVKVLGIQAAINAVVGMAKTIGTALANVATNAYNKAKEIGRNIVDGIVDGAKFLYNKVKAALDKLWPLITSVAGLALSAAVAIGTGIIEGIVSGLSGLVGRVAGSIKDKVTSAISTAIGWLTGSPEVTPAIPIGKGISLGIIRGFLLGIVDLPEKMNEKLRAALTRVQTTITGMQDRFNAAWSRFADGALTAFDAVTDRHLAGIQTKLDAVVARINATAARANVMLEAGKGVNAATWDLAAATAAVTTATNAQAAAQAALDAATAGGDEEAISKAKADLATATSAVTDATKAEAAAQEMLVEAQERATLATMNLQQAKGFLKTKKGEFAAALAGGDPTEIANALAQLKIANDAVVTLQEAKNVEIAGKKAAAATADAAERSKEYTAARTLQRTHLEDYLTDLGISLAKHPGMWSDAQKKVIKRLNALQVDFKTAGQDLGTAFAKGLGESLASVKTLLDGISSAIASFQAKQPAGKQLGGPVAKGTPYIVGEAGPELFMPSSAGRIVPNNQITATNGGGGGGRTEVYQLVMDSRVFAEIVRDRYGRISFRNGVPAVT